MNYDQYIYIQIIRFAGFEVLAVMVMKSSVFWDITMCSLSKVNPRVGGTCHIHLQGRRISQARNHHKAGSKKILVWTTQSYTP
jgi:hypothetical protein